MARSAPDITQFAYEDDISQADSGDAILGEGSLFAHHRTPIAESEELYFALKAQQVDSVLVRMPQEPHGAGSNYISHQIAKVMYLMKWFDKYIKG